MTQNQPKDTLNSFLDRSKHLAEKGNQRHLIIRNKNGTKVAEFSLTVVVILGAILVFSGWGIPLIIVGTLIGIAAKLQVEIVRDLAEDEKVIKIKKYDQ